MVFSLWQKAPRGKLASWEDYSLNKLGTSTEGNKLFRDPQALSSTLAALGMLQPRAFGSLNVYPSVSLSNYYLSKQSYVTNSVQINDNDETSCPVSLHSTFKDGIAKQLLDVHEYLSESS